VGIRTLLLAALLAFPAPALAGGGARVVDDAEIAAPGVCQVESWATAGRGYRLVHAAPAGTPRHLPNVEIGGFAEYFRERGEEDVVVGPNLKIALRPAEAGIGVALAGSLGFSLEDGRIGSAALVVPLTFDLADRLRANLNAGWAWTRGPVAHESVWGGQLEYAATQALGLVGELFGASGGALGYQAGLRWSPDERPFDLDLLVRGDRGAGTALTFGISVRR
jgi:hypothetical protein